MNPNQPASPGKKEQIYSVCRTFAAAMTKGELGTLLAEEMKEYSLAELQVIGGRLYAELIRLPAPYRDQVRPYFIEQLFGAHHTLLMMYRKGAFATMNSPITDRETFKKFCEMIPEVIMDLLFLVSDYLFHLADDIIDLCIAPRLVRSDIDEVFRLAIGASASLNFPASLWCILSVTFVITLLMLERTSMGGYMDLAASSRERTIWPSSMLRMASEIGSLKSSPSTSTVYKPVMLPREKFPVRSRSLGSAANTEGV